MKGLDPKYNSIPNILAFINHVNTVWVTLKQGFKQSLVFTTLLTFVSGASVQLYRIRNYTGKLRIESNVPAKTLKLKPLNLIIRFYIQRQLH